jgi:hypothetical protein
MNMPYMRKTNEDFLNWILSQKNGLYYPGEYMGGANSPLRFCMTHRGNMGKNVGLPLLCRLRTSGSGRFQSVL